MKSKIKQFVVKYSLIVILILLCLLSANVRDALLLLFVAPGLFIGVYLPIPASLVFVTLVIWFELYLISLFTKGDYADWKDGGFGIRMKRLFSFLWLQSCVLCAFAGGVASLVWYISKYVKHESFF